MSEDPDVRAYLESVPAEQRPIVDSARELLRDAYPAATETIKWNQLVYEVDGTNRFYIDHFTNHVNLGFMQGADLDDPEGLLEGTGKRMRHAKLRNPKEVANPALHTLVETAV